MSESSGTTGRQDRTAVVVGVLLLLLAGVLWYDAENLNRAVAYGVGPGAMPKVIAVGLAILGALSVLSGVKGERFEIEQTDWPAVLIIIGGFLVLTAVIGLNGGFIPAMTILFAVTSFAFGRRAVLVDLALGFALALLTYLLFSRLLALSLPQGPLERLF